MKRAFLTLFLSLSMVQMATGQQIYFVDSLHYPPPAFDTTVMDSVTLKRSIDISTCEMVGQSIFYLGGGWADAMFPVDFTFIDRENSIFNYCLVVSGQEDRWPDDEIGYTSGALINPWYFFEYAPELNPRGIAAVPNEVGFGTGYMVGTGVSFVRREGANLNLTDGDTIFYVGDLPEAYHSAGQMTRHKESFYYPSVNHELVKFKAYPDTFFYESIGALPDSLVYGGLFSIPYSCDSATTYLAHRGDSSTTFFVLDVETTELYWHCEIANYNSFSAMYPGEKDLPPCTLTLDLLAGDFETLDRSDTLCSGSIALLDDDLHFSHELEYDSIVIEILNPLDGDDEYLTIDDGDPAVWLAGNNSHRLTIGSTGFTKVDEFLSVLASLQYTNDLPTPSEGERLIEVQPYHPHYAVDSANIVLLVGNNSTLSAQMQVQSTSCFMSSDGQVTVVPLSGNAPYTVVWEDGSMGNPRYGLATGEYGFTLTDAGGCSNEFEVVVPEPDLLSANVVAPQDSVCGSSGVLIASIAGGTLPYEYHWSSGGTDQQEEGLEPGTYQLTVTDANQCEAEVAFTLFPAEPLEQYDQLSLCTGSSYDWQGITLTRDTSVCVTTTAVNGCDSLFCLDLTFLPTYFTEESFSLCAGESITLQGEAFTQDTVVAWQWLSTDGCDSTYQAIIEFNAATTDLFADICEGETYLFNGETLDSSGFYVANLQTVQGCDSIVTLDLLVYPAPSPDIIVDGSLCEGGNLELSASGYAAYTWSTGAQASSVTVPTAGLYTLTVTDSQGCTGSSTVAVTSEELQVEWSVLQPACPEAGGLVMIDSVTGGQAPYLLVINGTTIPVPGITDQLAPGSYVATVEDEGGCMVDLELIIEPAEEPTVALDETYTITLGDSVQLLPIVDFTPSSTIWNPSTWLSCADCLEPFASPWESTRYTLEVESPGGCEWSLSTLVTIERKGMYLPNAFSPNDDGHNDLFTFYEGPSVSQVHQFEIYDRWGSQVFVGAEGRWQWDGQVRGQIGASGIYIFFLEWEDITGARFQEKGELLLLR